MRDRFWNNLINIRFQAFYYDRYAWLIGIVDKASAIFLALVSSASVGAWLIWKEHPGLWALLIAGSQALIVVKPFLPFLRKSGDYTRCSLELEKLYNVMEKIWFECDKTKTDQVYETALAQLREKKLKIDTAFSGIPIISFGILIRKARADVDDFMGLNFPAKI